MNEGRCNFIVITKKNGLPSWLEIAGKTSFVGRHSYQPLDMEYNKLANEAFGHTPEFVPAYILSNRNWQLVEQDELTNENGEIESITNQKLQEICKK